MLRDRRWKSRIGIQYLLRKHEGINLSLETIQYHLHELSQRDIKIHRQRFEGDFRYRLLTHPSRLNFKRCRLKRTAGNRNDRARGKDLKAQNCENTPSQPGPGQLNLKLQVSDT
jgi:hypothetical protein